MLTEKGIPVRVTPGRNVKVEVDPTGVIAATSADRPLLRPTYLQECALRYGARGKDWTAAGRRGSQLFGCLLAAVEGNAAEDLS